MKNLIKQMIKFGMVGAICFVIDWLVGLIVSNIILHFAVNVSQSTVAAIASAIGFAVSVIFNYILSFKFVFERKQNLDRKYEFIAFISLSIIGLGINSLLIYIWMGPFYNSQEFLQGFGYNLNYTAAKVFATAVVMVYNFITRKVFLEEKKKSQVED